jgi:hypothetical protein
MTVTKASGHSASRQVPLDYSRYSYTLKEFAYQFSIAHMSGQQCSLTLCGVCASKNAALEDLVKSVRIKH